MFLTQTKLYKNTLFLTSKSSLSDVAEGSIYCTTAASTRQSRAFREGNSYRFTKRTNNH